MGGFLAVCAGGAGGAGVCTASVSGNPVPNEILAAETSSRRRYRRAFKVNLAKTNWPCTFHEVSFFRCYCPWLRAGPQLPEHPLSESSSGRTRKICQKDSNSWRLLNSAFLTKTKLSKLKVCRFCQDSILPGQELLTSFGIGLPWHGDLSSHLCINVVYHTGIVNRPEMIQRNCYPGSNGQVTIYVQTYSLGRSFDAHKMPLFSDLAYSSGMARAILCRKSDVGIQQVEGHP